METNTLKFNGSDYNPEMDNKRLSGQIKRIFHLMKDSQYRTLSEIAEITGDHEASISAQLRHLRKTRFGSHTVNKRNRGERQHGLYEYQLVLNLAPLNMEVGGIFKPIEQKEIDISKYSCPAQV